jgi:hypothetical protein
MPGIFISYRRHGEGAGYAGRLGDELRQHFGRDQVFRDIRLRRRAARLASVGGRSSRPGRAAVRVVGVPVHKMRGAPGRRGLPGSSSRRGHLCCA